MKISILKTLRFPLALAALTAVLSCVFESKLHAQAQVSAGANLIENGDFETDSKGENWPDKWGKPKAGASSWQSEEGKHFVRMESTEPGKMVMMHRYVPIAPDVKAVELSARVRVTGLVKGEKSWFDTRIMCDFVTGPGGSKIKGAKPLVLAGRDTTGWVDRKVRFNVPEGAKMIQIMPCLFNVNAGQMDIDEIALRAVDPVVPATAPAK